MGRHLGLSAFRAEIGKILIRFCVNRTILWE